MKVVILGCGRMAARLATHLSVAGHDVSVIDYDASQFQRLSSDFKGKKVLGDGTEQDTLRRAGIESAEVFVAITQGDNRNIMTSQIARVIFGVPRVYTRVKDPARAECFGQMGLKTFCTTILVASYLEDAVMGGAFPEKLENTPAAH
ncbi:MAG TPA: TrkA family potassium uptake protein [Armatimonadota bacterium]|nr:TrkA family potassium uptake protein [Armatimonadota bacterium]